MKLSIKSALQTASAICFCLASATLAFAAPKWELIWSDEFDGKKIDMKKWSYIPRGKTNWNSYMSDKPEHRSQLFDMRNGNVVLRGIVNPDKESDPVPYLTGGIRTQGKFSFCYGKVEIRAKVGCAQGAWPALWMMPDYKGAEGWPKSGEMDLLEHLNFENQAWQTIHTHYTYNLHVNNPPRFSTAKINKDDYNVYALEWTPDELRFYVNGKHNFTYPHLKNVPAEKKQWPFNNFFYIMLDMQLGGGWVGQVNPAHLPVEMLVDYVRVYKDANAKGAAATRVQKYETKPDAKSEKKSDKKDGKKSKKS